MSLKTLSDPAVRQEIQQRLAQLTETSAALWGVMSVHQMIVHLNDSYKVGLGTKKASPATGFLQRTVLKRFALQAPLTWPKGVPTRPEVAQGKGGTPPAQFALDRDELVATFEQFCADLPSPCLPHPMFGAMSISDWMRWGYLHADHHLRQFGQ